MGSASCKDPAGRPCGKVVKDHIKAHWLDALLVVIIAGLIGVVHFAVPVYQRFFLEQDPTLSYPNYPGPLESVPIFLLFAVCAVPVALFLILQIAVRIFLAERFRKRSPAANKIMDIPLAIIVILEVLALTLLGTELFKVFTGRLRPSFFAYCDYAGYRNALATNDFTEYYANTKFNAIGDISKCRDKTNLRDAQSSFPSGHSSVAMAMFVVSGLLALQLHMAWTQKHRILHSILVLVLAVAAGLISITRTRDYWHDFSDALAGSILGGVIAVFVFNVNYHDTSRIVQEIETKHDVKQLVEEEKEIAEQDPAKVARPGIDVTKGV